MMQRLGAQHLRHRGTTLQPRHTGEFVRTAQDAADIAQRDIRGVVGVGAGRSVRQDLPQLLAKALLPQKVRPDNQPAVGRETLVGEVDADGRRGVFGVNLKPHRLVCLLLRPGNLLWFHHRKPAKRCSPLQSESFRLRGVFRVRKVASRGGGYSEHW